MSRQSVLSVHLDSSTKDPHCPNVETALGVFTFHGRLSVHLQHKDVSFHYVLTKLTPHPLPFILQCSGFLFLSFSPPFAFAFQSSGSREYLASLERVAAWVAERVLPFLAQSGHDGEVMEEETTALAAHITKVRFCW